MTVQRAYLDYLRLGCWDDASALQLTSKLRTSIPKWRQGYWLQYKGWYGDNSFYGIGEQNRRRHYVWRSAGPSSSVLFELTKGLPEVYATRLDVQVTISLPEDYDVFAVYQDHKNLGGRGTSIIESDTGSTVYFGARTSDRFARLYTKEYDKGNFLRLEFEFKGKTAKAIYSSIILGRNGPTMIFQHFLKSFSLADYIIDWFDTGDDSEMERIYIENAQNDDHKLEWLHSLANTIIKMGNDHKMSESTLNFLRICQEGIDKNAD